MTTPAALRELLSDCDKKLRLYHEATKGEYPGGPPMQTLLPRIEQAVSQLLTAASEGGEAVAWQGRFFDDVRQEWGEWRPMTESEATTYASISGWQTRPLFTHPPEVARDAWILASESKPAEDVPVWCSINGTEPYFGTYSYAEGDEDGSGWAWMRCDSRPYFHDGKWKCDDIEWDDQYDVTHWQPLPEPPSDAALRARAVG